MAEAEQTSEVSTRSLDVIWNVIMVASVGFIAFMAWDMLSGGKATEQVKAVIGKVRPAAVPDGESDGHGSGG